ncbi:MAG: Sec-independent protein translocase protein TatB [Xanthobacteraceae bacterium]|nr:Sec-independent protein translocase protein TatB [Xanthobacteraceae bacterium]
MFDIGWSELLVIGIVALIVIGPKELPGALRTLGQWMAKIRRMASEFQGQFQEAMREAEIDQLKKDMDEMAAKAKDYTHFDPIEDVRRDIEKSVGDLPSLDQPATATTTTDAAAATIETATPPSDTTALPPPAEQTAATTPVPTPAEPEPVIADSKPAAGRASA